MTTGRVSGAGPSQVMTAQHPPIPWDCHGLRLASECRSTNILRLLFPCLETAEKAPGTTQVRLRGAQARLRDTPGAMSPGNGEHNLPGISRLLEIPGEKGKLRVLSSQYSPQLGVGTSPSRGDLDGSPMVSTPPPSFCTVSHLY